MNVNGYQRLAVPLFQDYHDVGENKSQGTRGLPQYASIQEERVYNMSQKVVECLEISQTSWFELDARTKLWHVYRRSNQFELRDAASLIKNDVLLSLRNDDEKERDDEPCDIRPTTCIISSSCSLLVVTQVSNQLCPVYRMLFCDPNHYHCDEEMRTMSDLKIFREPSNAQKERRNVNKRQHGNTADIKDKGICAVN